MAAKPQVTKALEPQASSSGFSVLAYAQLLRLPNVFTAIANVTMGFLVSRGSLDPWYWFALVVSASAALYLAGMVLNDMFDVAEDTRERPHRPIPSGRVTMAVARNLGVGLLASGMLLAWIVSVQAIHMRPGLVATLLAITVFMYDAGIKRTPLGPLFMGACRTLNVLLGMSLAGALLPGHTRALAPELWTIALAIGVYTAGVTWFARTEDQSSSRWSLMAGLAVMLTGLAMLGTMPGWIQLTSSLVVDRQGWYLFWSVLALIIARRCVLAIVEPSPARVQAAVKHAILSLIVIDAGICLGFCGIYWGCAVLLLLAPAIVLGGWVYST